jgi:DNA-binding GntR family transcriptional regulator
MTAKAIDKLQGGLAGDDEISSFKSLTGAVSRAVQQDILNARFLPGEKLPIVHLARDYGVSPGAIREALSRLISVGLVEFNEQRGFRAAPVSAAALMDITRTRIVIDAHALREAIRLGDAAWETEVRDAEQKLANCMAREPGNPSKVRPEWNRLHRIFHRTLISACGSHWLMRFHDQLFDQSTRYRAVAVAYEIKNPRGRNDAAREHGWIVAAALARDADAAAQAIETHYLATTKLIIESPEIDSCPSSETKAAR